MRETQLVIPISSKQRTRYTGKILNQGMLGRELKYLTYEAKLCPAKRSARKVYLQISRFFICKPAV